MNTAISEIEVSVLMPAYNREGFIHDAVQSILSQTFTNFELIIIDDGSTDNTVQQVLSFSDKRIRLLQNEHNCGISFTRNRLMKEATGKYWAILDSDDIALPDRLQTQLDFLNANPNVLLTGSAIIAINEKGNKINNKGAVIRRPTGSDEISATLLFRNCFFQSSVMINARLLNHAAYDPAFPPLEDYEFWSRLSMGHTLCNLYKPLVMYRYHPTNISHSTNEPFKFDLMNKITRDKFQFHLNYQPTPEELYLHNVWQFNTYSISYIFLKDSSRWLKKIQELNRSKKAFDKDVLIKVIKANWFQRCWYFAEKGNILTAFYFLAYNSNFKVRDIQIFFTLAVKGVFIFIKGQKR